MQKLQTTLRHLYTGRSRSSAFFRYGLIVFDAITIVYFIITATLPEHLTPTYLNFAVGIFIALDFFARLWISHQRWQMLFKIYTIADLIVLASLLLAPFIVDDVAFLRILRGLRLIHSYHLIRDLRQESRFFRMHEDAVYAAVNLFVFIFVTTSLVFVVAFDTHTGVETYIDALYFTVATLTTTGFGDITMTTPLGKLLSVFMMVIGVALFFQLARAILQPLKVRYKCPGCGLLRHDPDAIHCKHCGESLKIETEGNDA